MAESRLPAANTVDPNQGSWIYIFLHKMGSLVQLCKESWHRQVDGLSDTGKVRVEVWLARVK